MNLHKPQATALVFVCSGAADVGELTDRAAREIRRLGAAAMSCLASIGARDPDFMFNTDLAEKVLVIDGCPQDCARRTMELAGIKRFAQFDLTACGFAKGESPVTAERVQTVVQKALQVLGK
jgi:uncharacterized metal-binding protein